ncbi:MAG: MBOAT family protein [Flavobacteriales bacterium]|nr:MBOAT family protein [Flavobacteriales bacterium]
MLTWREIFLYSENNPLIFSQYLFLFLFTIGFGIFTVLHRNVRWRNIYLLAFSLFFYYKSGGLYFWLLVLSTVVDFYCGRAIYRSDREFKRRAILVFSLVSNLGLLFFFKYSYYFVGLINDVFGTQLKAINFLAVFANEGFGASHDIFDIALPVGISFYTFQTLSYTIDIYRRNLEPARNIIDFGFFVTFFPQLVAGPIVRAADFLPQIYKKFALTRAEFGAAVYLIMAGMFKKMVVSDYVSINFVDRVFDNPLSYSGFSNLMAIYGYSIQIYCDFSGYSDMAIGLAALLGFKLPLNFNSPYIATSITDFWRRWHISLSTWLRDYLYISLGGNRKGKVRTYINLMLTMLLGGLWHGAATRFIIWGGLHGAALAVHKVWMRYVPWSGNQSWWYKFLMGVLTFHFVAFCWIYFRAENLQVVRDMLGQIAWHFVDSGIWPRIVEYKWVFFIMAIGFMGHWLPASWKKEASDWYSSIPDLAKAAVFAVIIFVAYQAQSADIQPFIYFRF